MARPSETPGQDAHALAELVEWSADAIFRVDLEGRITSWNRGARETFGHEPEEILGRSFEMLFPGLAEQGLWARLLAGETIRGSVVDGRRADGRHIRVAWTAAPIRTAAVGDAPPSPPAALSMCARDVTEQEQREERFRQAVESSPTAKILSDADGRILLVNARAESLFGYPREELLNARIEMLVPARSRSSHPELRAGFLRDPQARAMGAGRDLHGRRKDGTEIPIEIGLTPIETDEGTLVLSAIIDVSERRQLEHRFRMAVESSPSAMVMVDDEGLVVLVNQKTEELFGYPRAELIGQVVEVLVPERFRPLHPEYRREFFQEAEARAMGAGRDLYGLHRDGTEFPVEIGLNPIRTPNGVLVLSAIVDITERKAGEERLRSTADELARSNADLEQFAYASSHDLQEPLRMIAGFLQLLEKRHAEGLPPDAREYVAFAVEGALRMRTLIDDLLAYSRVQTNERRVRRVPLRAAVEEACTNLSLAIEETGAEVEVGDLPEVEADPMQMSLLFQNLIGNAIKFRRSDPPRVRVDARPAGELWRIQVEDNGIGIEPRFAERIFGVFQRLHAREEYPGTGIGLAICKRIVERHGGRIHVEPAATHGSVFVIELPRRSSDR